MAKELPTLEYLRECFDLNADTGELTWKVRPREHFRTHRGWKVFCSRFAGRVVMPKLKADRLFVLININGERLSFKQHRIVYCLHNNVEPSDIDRLQVDHIDLSTRNNRPSNLRLVTNRQNQMNVRSRRGSACHQKGVYWDSARGKYVAQIKLNGRATHLGRYGCPDAAHEAYKKAADKHFGEHARHG